VKVKIAGREEGGGREDTRGKKVGGEMERESSGWNVEQRGDGE